MDLTVAEALARCPELANLLGAQQKKLESQSAQIDFLVVRVKWLESQVFGQSSEKRAALVLPKDQQLWLLEQILAVPAEPPDATTTVKGHERARRKNPAPDLVDAGSQLRFGPEVPIKVIDVVDPRAASIPEEYRELISERTVYKLARRRTHLVLQYNYKTYKDKRSGELISPAAVEAVIPGSSVDVSFLSGLLTDKFVGHLPLYRQHQRLTAENIFMDRGNLSRLVHHAAQFLEPIYQAIQSSVLQSKVLGVDESPTPAGKAGGKMRQGYFWAYYGDNDEIFFHFSPSRSAKVLHAVLEGFQGILLSDGYTAYESFVSGTPGVLHAGCWVHGRRNFIEAEKLAPDRCKLVLAALQQLYQLEKLAPPGSEEMRRIRDTQSRQIVDELFRFFEHELAASCFAPSNPYIKAVQYMLDRRKQLRLFLDHPDLPLDTNHVERSIRPAVVGRKNWLFHSTEAGARYAAIIYSLVHSCTLAGVDPRTYLIDVLQRIATHPARDVAMLTPKNWARHFASNPMRSPVCAD